MAFESIPWVEDVALEASVPLVDTDDDGCKASSPRAVLAPELHSGYTIRLTHLPQRTQKVQPSKQDGKCVALTAFPVEYETKARLLAHSMHNRCATPLASFTPWEQVE